MEVFRDKKWLTRIFGCKEEAEIEVLAGYKR
jgi:hypothetical protein